MINNAVFVPLEKKKQNGNYFDALQGQACRKMSLRFIAFINRSAFTEEVIGRNFFSDGAVNCRDKHT